MRILVTGSRDHSDPDIIREVLDGLYFRYLASSQPGEQFHLYHGDAKGADAHAKEWVEHHPGKVVLHPYPAKWEWVDGVLRNRGEGHARNARMLQGLLDQAERWEEKLFRAFPSGPLRESRGTSGMVDLCRANGLKGYVIGGV